MLDKAGLGRAYTALSLLEYTEEDWFVFVPTTGVGSCIACFVGSGESSPSGRAEERSLSLVRFALRNLNFGIWDEPHLFMNCSSYQCNRYTPSIYSIWLCVVYRAV